MEIENEALQEAAVLHNKLMNHNINIDEVCSTELLTRIHDIILQRKKKLLNHLQTTSLSLQYIYIYGRHNTTTYKIRKNRKLGAPPVDSR